MYKRVIFMLCLLAASATGLSAETVSYTGTLASSESVFTTTFTLATADTVTFQTWSFGGGMNASGQAIAAGGFDPLLSLFSGTGSAATMVVDGSGNPLADGDVLYNPPWSYVGNCPAAGTVNIGGDNDCGDVYMQVSLDPGTYTLVLSDAGYIPDAVFDNGTLSEGFVDLTGVDFQTCDPNTNTCIAPNNSYAVDVIDSQAAPAVTPEPSSLSLLGIGLTVLAGAKRYISRRMSPLKA